MIKLNEVTKGFNNDVRAYTKFDWRRFNGAISTKLKEQEGDEGVLISANHELQNGLVLDVYVPGENTRDYSGYRAKLSVDDANEVVTFSTKHLYTEKCTSVDEVVDIILKCSKIAIQQDGLDILTTDMTTRY